jgi:hypothetical protein
MRGAPVPLVDLVIAPEAEARALSEANSLAPWEAHNIDPFDTALHQLVAHLTGREFAAVVAEVRDLVPAPEGLEPWDEAGWIPQVFALPDWYVAALAGIEPAALSKLAAWWFALDTFEHIRNHSRGFTKRALTEHLCAIRAFLAGANGRTVLMRVSM